MFVAALLAALAVTTSAPVAVPFLPQTEALCGGAAAAMVFRYWGDAHADAQQFAPLIEKRGRAAGIADGVLTDAVQSRGWRTERTDGTLTALDARTAAGQPVIVLLSDRRDLYHYVVVIGTTENVIVVHDPSWGPSRTIPRAKFSEWWTASRNWSLVVLPDPGRKKSVAPPSDASTPARALDACETATSEAVAATQARGLDHADEIFAPVQSTCPRAAGPWRELAGVRFAQHRWTEAVTLAREALDRQPDDEYAQLTLGSSLFMLDEPVGALRAWNAIGRPKLDTVRIDGVTRSRYQTVYEYLDLRTNELLTADAFLRARHRLDDLPDRSSSRITMRPEDDGYATLDVVVAEKAGIPRGTAEWIGAAVRAGVDREIDATIPGFTGQGEMWSAGWRWWHNRPRVAVAFEAPRVGGLPGVWRVEGSWEKESYATGSAISSQSRTHGALTTSDWLTGHVRYSLGAGIDAWDTAGNLRAASVGASLERRWLDDRVSVDGRATMWWRIAGTDAASTFNALGARVTAISNTSAQGWVMQAISGIDGVSDVAPLTLWSGAGEGRARGPLLRAHPLLDDGAIDLAGTNVFGRTTRYASGEIQRWLDRPALPRLGLAAFVDIANASRGVTVNSGMVQTDIGAGIRVRLPGVPQALRVDYARGFRDGANAVTVGWTFLR